MSGKNGNGVAASQTSASRAVVPTLNGKDLTPRYFRELVRLQWADSNLKRLHEIAQGETKFATPVVLPGSKDSPARVEWHDLEAPAMVQVIAAKALVEVAIPKQMGLVDGDDKGTGVIWMPAFEGAEAEDVEYEVVEEDMGLDTSRAEDRDVAPPQLEATVRPEYVQHVLAERKRKNGKA